MMNNKKRCRLLMGIDSEDEEAGSILMSLAHKTIKNPQPTINKKVREL